MLGTAIPGGGILAQLGRLAVGKAIKESRDRALIAASGRSLHRVDVRLGVLEQGITSIPALAAPSVIPQRAPVGRAGAVQSVEASGASDAPTREQVPWQTRVRARS
mgnify:CR=1 FL=1